MCARIALNGTVCVVMMQVQSVEFSARLPSPEAADDGYCWVERAPRPGEMAGHTTTLLRCSLDECRVEKDLVMCDGQCIVHYRGVHCHPRPLLQLRDEHAHMRCVPVRVCVCVFCVQLIARQVAGAPAAAAAARAGPASVSRTSTWP